MKFYDEDGPTVELITRQLRKSAVLRRCSECGEEIEIGKMYERNVYKIDGDMLVVPSHPGGGACLIVGEIYG